MAARDVSPLVNQLPRVLGRAALRPLHLLVAGAGVVGAIALHSWPVFVLGGVAYVGLVGWRAASPAFWRETLQQPSRDGAKLPALESLHVPRVREAVQAITSARAELDSLLTHSPEEVRRYLEMALASLNELEERSARLVHHAEDLARYLRTVDIGAVRKQVERLKAQAHAARDAEARASYESARAAREEQLTALADIDAAHERVLAHLSRIVATFQGLPAKVMRLRALDAQATDSLSGDLSEELGRMNGEIGAFEETLKSFQPARVAS
ncbi:hypothetical protein P2318_27060 [Myxococcaceae bacterium GXIMD 01537]